MDSDRKAKSVQSLHIKHADNGGYIVRHEYDNSMAGPSYSPSTEHAFSTHDEMMTHVGKHLKSGFKGQEGAGTSHLLTKGMATVKGNIANPQAPEGEAGKAKRPRSPQGVQPAGKKKGWRSLQGSPAPMPKGVQSKAPTSRTYGAGAD